MEHIRWSSVECIIGLNLLARTILIYPINCVETANKSGLSLHGRAEGDLVNGGGVWWLDCGFDWFLALLAWDDLIKSKGLLDVLCMHSDCGD
jgi:hypothetical protein